MWVAMIGIAGDQHGRFSGPANTVDEIPILLVESKYIRVCFLVVDIFCDLQMNCIVRFMQ